MPRREAEPGRGGARPTGAAGAGAGSGLTPRPVSPEPTGERQVVGMDQRPGGVAQRGLDRRRDRRPTMRRASAAS